MVTETIWVAEMVKEGLPVTMWGGGGMEGLPVTIWGGGGEMRDHLWGGGGGEMVT